MLKIPFIHIGKFIEARESSADRSNMERFVASLYLETPNVSKDDPTESFPKSNISNKVMLCRWSDTCHRKARCIVMTQSREHATIMLTEMVNRRLHERFSSLEAARLCLSLLLGIISRWLSFRPFSSPTIRWRGREQ
jgi:hypothetical protein